MATQFPQGSQGFDDVLGAVVETVEGGGRIAEVEAVKVRPLPLTDSDSVLLGLQIGNFIKSVLLDPPSGEWRR